MYVPIRTLHLVGYLFAYSLFFLATDRGGAATVYRLSSDWSEDENPNAVWAYRAGDLLLPRVSDWAFSNSDEPMPGWGASLPFWFKSRTTNDISGDWQLGDVVVHTQDDWNGGGNGPAVVTWTSPLDGIVEISGGVWMGRDVERGNEWRLYVRGVGVSKGEIASGDPYSRLSPFRFDLGTGGPGVLRTVVARGDVITLEIVRTTVAGDFVGVDLEIILDERVDLLPSIRVASVDICWAGISNQWYQVQYASELTANEWVNLGDPVAGNGTNCFTDDVRDFERRFYRVIDAPAD